MPLLNKYKDRFRYRNPGISSLRPSLTAAEEEENEEDSAIKRRIKRRNSARNPRPPR